MTEQDEKTLKDICNIVEKILKLQRQIENPTRQGMIDALREAQSVALFEVKSLEFNRRNTVLMPYDSFTNVELYGKLPVFQEALRNHAINLAGQKAFEEALHNVTGN